MEKTKNNILTYKEFFAKCNAFDKKVKEMDNAWKKLRRASEFLSKYVRAYAHNNKYDGQMWDTYFLISRAASFGMVLSCKTKVELFNKKMEFIDTCSLA